MLVRLLPLLGLAAAFKTGLEDGLICNVCVGTHPGQSGGAGWLLNYTS